MIMDEETLRRCEDKFSRVVAWSRDGILLIDESGSVVEWSPAMEQISGLSRSDALGKKVWDIQYALLPEPKKSPQSLEHLKNLVIPVLRDSQSPHVEHRFEHEIHRPDQGIRFIESFLFQIPMEKGFMAGAILRDITDRKKDELALQEANRKLNLMSSITRHDINNQLTIFGGYLSLLETGGTSLKTGDVIRILQDANTKIQRILKFTREYQDVGVKAPVWQVLGGTIGTAKTPVDAGNVRFSYGNACDEMEIYADPMLVRVFSNLIDNSLRHGETVSEIRVDCTVKDNYLVIVYEDNGIGISDKIRPVLFERGKGKNTGYGMFLIREILTITGFAITENGEHGKGVRFEIVVPAGSFRPAGKSRQQ
jgi:PAS domain S-box-containing protein